MNNNMKLLYITFIDFGKAISGSSVRPQKMYAAFGALGCDILLLEGQQNDRSRRRKNVKAVLKKLKSFRPDICYIEPPSGPFFNSIDHELLRRLKKMHVPMGLFYRDMYWKFGLQKGNGLISRIKASLVSCMQRRDWRRFSKTLNIIYFPTEEMAKILPCSCAVKALPPGCFEAAVRYPTNEVPTGIYVGGVAELYGTEKLLRAAEQVNAQHVKFRLKLVCRETEWNRFVEQNNFHPDDRWLEVLHISGDDQLSDQYGKSDFALCPQQVTEYNHITISVKFMEYISYGKPIIVTACRPLKSYVEQYGIGIVAEDTTEDFARALERMAEDPVGRGEMAQRCLLARSQNLWIDRAQTVIKDLSAINEG